MTSFFSKKMKFCCFLVNLQENIKNSPINNINSLAKPSPRSRGADEGRRSGSAQLSVAAGSPGLYPVFKKIVKAPRVVVVVRPGWWKV
jgi:hypothetical protein